MSKVIPERTSGDVQRCLARLFLMLTATVLGLAGSYWFLVLEPWLAEDAQTTARTLAQSHAYAIADGLVEATRSGRPDALENVMDEVLLLTDQVTFKPFVTAIQLHPDYQTLEVPEGRFNLFRGTPCPDCFTVSLALHASDNRWVGMATFYCSDLFFKQVRDKIRSRLVMGLAILMLLLGLIWRMVVSLVREVKAKEEEASQAMRVKGEFLATMSHEIRTPLNGVLGMADLMRKTPLDEEQKGFVHAIAISGEALMVILNDILDLSKMEAGKLHIVEKSFDLSELLGSVLFLNAPKAQEKRLELRREIAQGVPSVVVGDAVRLRQVLLNLVGNAVKFTEEGSVTLAVRSIGDPGAGKCHLEFSVADTGIGISDDVRLRLFENFAQGDASITRRYGGTGLGLAICRRLITAMGGHVGVESRFGRGSRFYFDVVLEAGRPSESPPVIPAPLPPLVLNELNVLVADDGDINRRVVNMLLTKEGHKVVEVVDGQEALEAAARGTFDVILMDLQMPVMDGLEATRQIRQLADPEKAHVPIIALTANAMRDEREAALAAGMDGFVTKPFQLERLKEELTTVLARRHCVKGEVAVPA